MTFQEFLEEQGFDTRSYSGRSMYGKECLAVTVDDTLSAMQQIAYAAGAQDIDMPDYVSSDSMGRSSFVLYWPNEPFNSEDEDDEDDEEFDEEDDE